MPTKVRARSVYVIRHRTPIRYSRLLPGIVPQAVAVQNFLDYDLLLRAKPAFQLVAVFSAPVFSRFVRAGGSALRDFVVQLSRALAVSLRIHEETPWSQACAWRPSRPVPQD
jgi:hypothetical protein